MVALSLVGCQAMPASDESAARPAPVARPAPEPAARAPCPECPPRCPEPRVIEKVVYQSLDCPSEPKTAGELQLPIIGAVEWVTVDPPGLRLEARIDSGAETTSIHADDIELVEIDGKRYVRYVLTDPASGATHQMETRLRRRVTIIRPEGIEERRFVVRLWLTLGEFRTRAEVTLTDRSDMEFPLLIGRNMLTDVAIVDVSQHHTFLR
jgi:hypothetical protein